MAVCGKCGRSLEDGACFCTNCGTPIAAPKPTQTSAQDQPREQTPSAPPVTPANSEDKKKSGKGEVWLIAGLGGVALIGVIVAVVLLVANARSQARLEEQQKLWAAFTEEIQVWLADTDTYRGKLIFDAGRDAELDAFLSELNDKLHQGPDWENGDGPEGARTLCQEDIERDRAAVEALLETVRAQSADQVNRMYDQLVSEDVSRLSASELSNLNARKAEAERAIAQGDYRRAVAALSDWQTALEQVLTPQEDLTVTVTQYDLSDYPTIRVYVDVTDAGDNFISGLGQNAFYVNECRSVGGPITRRTVSRVAQIGQNAGISIGLVADVSGSMYNAMDDTRRIMRNFMNTVQFDKGDEVELVEFASTSYICNAFTNDRSQIIRSIDSLSAGGQTRLYDTLISEIERIPTRSNAKCIIGFTDGYDNLSFHTPQDVINSARAYHIPVFLIGVGNDCDTASLRAISNGTGGFYQNAANIGALESIYNSIYRQATQMYLVEFDVTDGGDLTNPCYLTFQVRSADGRGGHLDNYAVEPMDFFTLMYSKFLVAGMDCQTKGERNLLESGIITTNEESYSNHNCVAWQSEESIRTKGPGSNNSNIFEVLTGYKVLRVDPSGDGFIVYGISEYDISLEKKYSRCRDAEKEAIQARYGSGFSDDTTFWVEESIYNYEKLTLIRDTDGKWKFHTRVYERPEGNGSAYGVNQVYQVNTT